jgi:hypothetical protein
MYQSFSVSCNVRGGKAIGGFAGGIFAAEIISKLILVLMVYRLDAGAAAASPNAAQVKSPVPVASETAVTLAAQQWLGLIDAGHYSESWRHAAPLFQTAITESAWGQALTAARQPLNKMLSRNVMTAQTSRNIPGLSGRLGCIMQFETSFEKKGKAIETVTFQQQPDGTWKAAGYFIK